MQIIVDSQTVVRQDSDMVLGSSHADSISIDQATNRSTEAVLSHVINKITDKKLEEAREVNAVDSNEPKEAEMDAEVAKFEMFAPTQPYFGGFPAAELAIPVVPRNVQSPNESDQVSPLIHTFKST